ncbi:NAD(P)-binding protein [Dentipellis sp. KUC8613]|nr:NAD(P)-binding protein [Dentipellis sp. KUC8613]
MPPIPNPALYFDALPRDAPTLQDCFSCKDTMIDLQFVPLAGGILVETIACSLDPYMRNRMRPADEPGDMPAFLLGKVVDGFSVGVVLRSEMTGFAEGQHVYGFMPYQKYNVFEARDGASISTPMGELTILANPYNLPWRYFVGILGMSGQTAYYGLKEISDPKPGETIFVSAAAGAVGQVVVQLAKAMGLRVIASCGSIEKEEMLKEFGADHVINRHTCSISEELAKYGPIDIYFDNVGGAALEAAISNAAMNARFVICGANLWLVNRYRIKIEALVVTDWHKRYAEEFYNVMPRKVASREIKYREHVYCGLKYGGHGMADLMAGRNVGKAVIVLDERWLS